MHHWVFVLAIVCYPSIACIGKTLVIITGSVRGSLLAHQSLERHLLQPYGADLFLCTGKSNDRSSYLYSLATYLEEYPQTDNWRDAADTVSEEIFGHVRWRDYDPNIIDECLTGKYDENNRWTGIGSGLLTLTVRYYAWKWLQKSGILDRYDSFVVSRSDYYYVADHPNISKLLSLNNHKSESNHVAIPFIHEDHLGICDRHAVLDREGLEAYLTAIVPFLEFHPEYGPYPNIESVLFAALCKHRHFTPFRYQLPAYMVRANDDKTPTWSTGQKQDSNGLWIKQYKEYEEAHRYIKNKQKNEPGRQ